MKLSNDKVWISYRYPESVIEGFDSGMVSLNSLRKIKKGDWVITISSDGRRTLVALFKATGKVIPNYITNRVFTPKPDNRYTTLDGYGMLPIKTITIDTPLKMVRGGKVLNSDKSFILEELGL